MARECGVVSYSWFSNPDNLRLGKIAIQDDSASRHRGCCSGIERNEVGHPLPVFQIGPKRT